MKKKKKKTRLGAHIFLNRNTLMMKVPSSSFRIIEIPCAATANEAREKPASSITMQIFHGAFLSSKIKIINKQNDRWARTHHSDPLRFKVRHRYVYMVCLHFFVSLSLAFSYSKLSVTRTMIATHMSKSWKPKINLKCTPNRRFVLFLFLIHDFGIHYSIYMAFARTQ